MVSNRYSSRDFKVKFHSFVNGASCPGPLALSLGVGRISTLRGERVGKVRSLPDGIPYAPAATRCEYKCINVAARAPLSGSPRGKPPTAVGPSTRVTHKWSSILDAGFNNHKLCYADTFNFWKQSDSITFLSRLYPAWKINTVDIEYNIISNHISFMPFIHYKAVA